MEAIGFGIMWFYAALLTLSAVMSAMLVGKPKSDTTYTLSGAYIGAGGAILFIYALVLIIASR